MEHNFLLFKPFSAGLHGYLQLEASYTHIHIHTCTNRDRQRDRENGDTEMKWVEDKSSPP